MTCINCPLGCTLSVEIDGENINVSGNRCKRGAEYAASEIRAPKRMVTSTVRVTGGDKPLVSVKTSGEIPKGRIFDVIHAINKKTSNPPIKVGDVVIEDYATGLFRKWGIGSKEKNNGVLILIAYKNPSSLKKSRIEVGYGLEGALPDAKTGRIQDDYMIPYFKDGDYSSGILNGYAVICSEVAKEYNVTLDSLSGSGVQQRQSRNVNVGNVSVNPILLIILIILFLSFDGFFFKWAILRIILSMIFGRGGRGGFGGGGGGFGGFGGGSSGGGGSSRDW
jgi:uncharacterized protein